MDMANKSDPEILTIADPIMDNLMEASTAIDHARHVRDFTDRLNAIVTKDYLAKVCLQYQSEKGFFGARTPVPSSGSSGSLTPHHPPCSRPGVRDTSFVSRWRTGTALRCSRIV